MKVLEDNATSFQKEDASSRFSEDITEPINRSPCCNTWLGVAMITPELYLCPAAAVSCSMLRALRITCIVNAAPELPATPAPDHVTRVRVPIHDTCDADVMQHLDRLADTIEEVRACGGRTLVHCVAGISRSAALCLGYLVKHEGMSLRAAFLHLRSRRPAVKPNCGFFRQLIEFETAQRGSATVGMVYNEITHSEIPDLYEQDYRNMLYYQAHYKRRFGRD